MEQSKSTTHTFPAYKHYTLAAVESASSAEQTEKDKQIPDPEDKQALAKLLDKSDNKDSKKESELQ